MRYAPYWNKQEKAKEKQEKTFFVFFRLFLFSFVVGQDAKRIIIASHPVNQVLRYSLGLIPTCSLKYFPKNDWLGKFISSAICLMVLVVFFSMTRISSVT